MSYPVDNTNPNSPYFIPGWTSQNNLPGPLVTIPVSDGLPTNWSRVLVTGYYVGLDGAPTNGVITFSVQGAIVDPATKTTIMPTYIHAVVANGVLTSDGRNPLYLLSTDDPNIQPTGFTYHVVEKLPGGRTFDMVVPKATTGAISLSDIAPSTLASGGTVQKVEGPTGPTGVLPYNFKVQATPPLNPALNDIWIDIS